MEDLLPPQPRRHEDPLLVGVLGFGALEFNAVLLLLKGFRTEGLGFQGLKR